MGFTIRILNLGFKISGRGAFASPIHRIISLDDSVLSRDVSSRRCSHLYYLSTFRFLSIWSNLSSRRYLRSNPLHAWRKFIWWILSYIFCLPRGGSLFIISEWVDRNVHDPQGKPLSLCLSKRILAWLMSPYYMILIWRCCISKLIRPTHISYDLTSYIHLLAQGSHQVPWDSKLIFIKLFGTFDPVLTYF